MAERSRSERAVVARAVVVQRVGFSEGGGGGTSSGGGLPGMAATARRATGPLRASNLRSHRSRHTLYSSLLARCHLTRPALLERFRGGARWREPHAPPPARRRTFLSRIPRHLSAIDCTSLLLSSSCLRTAAQILFGTAAPPRTTMPPRRRRERRRNSRKSSRRELPPCAPPPRHDRAGSASARHTRAVQSRTECGTSGHGKDDCRSKIFERSARVANRVS